MAVKVRLRVREFLLTVVAAVIILAGLPSVWKCAQEDRMVQSALSNFNSLFRAEEDNAGLSSEEAAELQGLLARASMANKTVIITTLNDAWAAHNTMIDLYLGSFRRGQNIEHLLQHLVIVTLDHKAHDRCIQLHPHCFRLKTTRGVDFTGEKSFMSEDYLKMMWKRIKFLGTVIEMGYSFVFSDADIMWFRNPFDTFYHDNVDFQIACDRYRNPYLLAKNSPNGGFVYVRSNTRTIAMYKYWYEARLRNPDKHDQDVLMVIFREEEFLRMQVKIRFLDTLYFSGFCQKSRDMTRVITMHANCCKGLQNKLTDLQLSLEDWSLYKDSISPTQLGIKVEGAKDQLNPWRVPFACLKTKWPARKTSAKLNT